MSSRRPKTPGTRPRKVRREGARRPKKIPNSGAAAVVTTGRDPITGQFLKGTSGFQNRKRSVVPQEVREKALSYCAEGIELLHGLMHHDDPQIKFMAIKLMLDRGLGKAIQPLMGAPGTSLVNITIANGGLITAEDAEAVYREVCGDPHLDISAIKFEAPRPAQPPIEHVPQPVLESDPLAPAADVKETTQLWERLGK